VCVYIYIYIYIYICIYLKNKHNYNYIIDFVIMIVMVACSSLLEKSDIKIKYLKIIVTFVYHLLIVIIFINY